MERHGLPKYRQSAWLADATGLSYAQAHRRMTGAAAWALEDLEQVARLFGESLADVVTLGEAGGGPVPAVMKLGAASLPCELWIGEAVENPKPDTVVAVKTASGWAALYASEAAERPTYAVERLQAQPSAAQRKTVAVLDSDASAVETICGHLQDAGYDARAFQRIEDLEPSATSGIYDAFVLDWIVGDSTTAGLIASVRAQNAACPIVLLTDQVQTGQVHEAEIADAVTRFNLAFSEKPVRLAILSASLARAFSLK